MSGITNFLVGGKQKQGSAYQQLDPKSPEGQLVDSLNKALSTNYDQQGAQAGQFGQQANDITALFIQHLKDFLVQGPNPTPDQINQASQFVDQTFTNPTQNVVNQNIADYQSQAQGRAAALGRDPNADIATQQAIAGEGLRQNIGLQSERGARIQQATNDNYNRGLAGLNAGMQGSGFLNGLTQQAFSNQLNLLNGQSGLANYYQRNRANSGNAQTSSGFLTNLGSIAGNGAKLGGAIYGLASGNPVGVAVNSMGPTGEYRSSGGIGG